jgi:hypothetical protein
MSGFFTHPQRGKKTSYSQSAFCWTDSGWLEVNAFGLKLGWRTSDLFILESLMHGQRRKEGMGRILDFEARSH